LDEAGRALLWGSGQQVGETLPSSVLDFCTVKASFQRAERPCQDPNRDRRARVPADVPAGIVDTFVDGVDAAFETAKELAGDKDILIMGADVARQFLQRGLIDEISIHLVPVVFGSGTRLFEGLDGEHISLDITETIQTLEAIHMRFRDP